MIRCALLATLLATALPAAAQNHRSFPSHALRGEIVVQQPPAVLLNGRPAQLAPGARVRNANNMLMLTGELAGARWIVHYTIDLQGSLLDVWVLNPAELARKPWPATPEQAQRWAFDPLAQVWIAR
jgi:hypothetical protein